MIPKTLPKKQLWCRLRWYGRRRSEFKAVVDLLNENQSLFLALAKSELFQNSPYWASYIAEVARKFYIASADSTMKFQTVGPAWLFYSKKSGSVIVSGVPAIELYEFLNELRDINEMYAAANQPVSHQTPALCLPK